MDPMGIEAGILLTHQLMYPLFKELSELLPLHHFGFDVFI
jgi:hypothetical protein